MSDGVVLRRHSSSANLEFLSGGGEMGARMRALDWSTTPLGPADAWPQSLCSALSICLGANFPIALYCGEQLCLLYNDAWSPILGTKHPSALGLPGREVWPELWDTVGPLFAAVFATGEATRSNDALLAMHRHGFTEECYFDYTFSPIRDEAGRVAGIFNAVVETTFRVIGERRSRVLRDLSERIAEATDASTACRLAAEVFRSDAADLPFALVYLTDPSAAGSLSLNGSAGIPPDAPWAPRHLDATRPGPWPIAQALQGGRPIRVSELSRRLELPISGGLWPESCDEALVVPLGAIGASADATGVLIAGISPRLRFDGEYQAFMERIGGAVSSAVSRTRALEQERRRAEALAEIDRAKTLFFSNVSHEFRTPLTLILGPLDELLGVNALAAADRERIELVHRNAQRLLKLVNALLEFTRIEAGRVRATYEPTDLAALTRDLASNFRSMIERAGLVFRVECPTQPEPVYVDREMWEKIVLNLLSNAFKFTLRGEILVRMSREGSHLVLEVADSGVGIPESELPRLFERFHRVEGTTGRSQEGSGIGLALVQELVKLHGGTVQISSRLGQGTTCRVELPFGSAHLPAERLQVAPSPSLTTPLSHVYVQEALRWMPVEPGETHSGVPALIEIPAAIADTRFAATQGARIVLADDNSDMRAYLRELLAPLYVIEAVTDGEQALAAARAHKPDLLLSDVMMPNLDGFGLVKRVREDETLRDTPVILLSARAGEEARIEGLDAGADDYLVKPFSARELLARVGALLERRRSQEAFRLRTAQFETLLAAAPLGVYLVDGAFRIRDVNPPAQAVLGDATDLVGRDFDEVVHRIWPKAHADEVVRLFRRTLETGESHLSPEHIEERLDRGVMEFYEWQIHRIPLPEGGHGVVCYFRDISRDVAMRRKLEDADRRKDEFLAILSHELRNPLAPIRNAAELLGAPKVTPEQIAWAQRVIQRQARHMAWLLDDLLDVARITQGKLPLQKERALLTDIVDAALETARPLLDRRQHHLGIHLPDAALELHADALRLAQVLSNLLTNAAKYTDPGGRIELRAQTDDAGLHISVKDNGVGIPPAALAGLFTLFSQVESTMDRAEGGLGIGLALVKGLTALHGGTVEARSAGRGHGSEFIVHLPRSMIAQERHRPLDTPAVTPRTLGRRVLVADDNQDAADSLALLLQVIGHQVRVAYGGNAALSLAQAFRPEVALIDIGMPDLNGHRVAQALRQEPWGRMIHLVALTGWGQEDDRQKALAAGFNAHLTKPVEMAQLSEILAPPH